MCECGCTLNDDRYTLPGPKGSMYLVTAHGGCDNCDSPPNITIEHFDRGTFDHEYNSDPDNGASPMKLEKWGEGKGIALVTGPKKSDFVKAAKSHLIGIASEDFGENGKIDEIGAETILEEMHGDARVKPHVPKRTKAVH